MATKKPLTAEKDGFEWIVRGGDLWGDYATVKAYRGLASENSARNYVCRNNLRRARFGNRTIVAKSDIDREAGYEPADDAA